MKNNWKLKIDKECKIRGLARSTKIAYTYSMGQLLSFYKGKKPEELGIEEIKDFIFYLRETKKLEAISTNRILAGIKFYYLKILNRNWNENALPRLKQKRKIPEVLSRAEVLRMIHVTRNIKHKAILMTLYSTGMRQSEVAKLKAEDIDSKRMVINIREGKGGDDRQALLSPDLLDMLRKYWVKNKDDKSKYLFPCSKSPFNKKAVGEKLSHTAIGYVVTRAAKLAQIKKKFRHTHSDTPLRSIY